MQKSNRMEIDKKKNTFRLRLSNEQSKNKATNYRNSYYNHIDAMRRMIKAMQNKIAAFLSNF